jgi:hypothetical protein
MARPRRAKPKKDAFLRVQMPSGFWLARALLVMQNAQIAEKQQKAFT